MKWLNGLKTALGTVGLAVVALNDVVHVLPEAWRPYIAGASAVLTALGLAHKVEKRRERQAQRIAALDRLSS
jgi:hypothetical protein